MGNPGERSKPALAQQLVISPGLSLRHDLFREKRLDHKVDKDAKLRRKMLAGWPEQTEGALVFDVRVQHGIQLAPFDGLPHHEVR